MLGKTPRKILAVRPMKDGVIADFEIAEGMIKELLKRVTPARSLFRPKILIAVPSGITGVEKRAVEDSALRAGAQEVILIEEPMAAAIGVDLPVHEPSANMIIDIGGGGRQKLRSSHWEVSLNRVLCALQVMNLMSV